eukprot:3935625-Rhodomonas_salina.2
MNEQAGALIPPMHHCLKDNMAVAEQIQGNQQHMPGVQHTGAVLLLIIRLSVAAQALQAHTARPTITQPAVHNSVRPTAVEAQPSNIGSHYCNYSVGH